MKRKRGLLRWIILLLILLVVILYIFVNFLAGIRGSAEKAVQAELENVGEKYVFEVRTELQQVQIAGETIAQVINSLSVKDEEMIGRYMAAAAEETGIFEALFYEKGKDCIDQEGNHIEIADRKDIPVIELPADKTQYVYLENEELTGKPAMLLVVPVPETEAALLLFYTTEIIKESLTEHSMYGQETFTAITDAKGDILEHNDVSSNFLSSGNLWTYVGEEYDKQISRVKANMKNKEYGYCAIKAGEEMRALVYKPIGIDDWTFVAGIDQNYVDQKVNRSFQKSSAILYQLFIVFPLLGIVCLGIYICSKRNIEEKSKVLLEKADTDQLTGLYNKLATERKIKEYMEENPNTLSMMLVLDIDNFKKINDTMGHAFGDEVLRNLGKSISANFRVSDIIGRTGGDEFTVFLKALKDDSNTLKEAQKLVNFFQGFQVGEYVKYSATASIGAAVFPADGSDFKTLYKAADQALYKAKARGKNQVAFYDDRDRKT